jgi:hypothetical protein
MCGAVLQLLHTFHAKVPRHRFNHVPTCSLNLLKPTGYVMHHQFNIQELYTLPTLYLCIYLRTNSDSCHLQHKLVAFYDRVEKCLQRGTDWVFK